MEPHRHALAERLLKETVAFYNLGNRSMMPDGGSSCAYFGKNDRRCAIGRIMPNTLKKYFDNGTLENTHCLEKLKETAKVCGITFRFKQEYRPLMAIECDEVMDAIQGLHDQKENWTATGLSEKGYNHVDHLCDRYNFNRKNVLP